MSHTKLQAAGTGVLSYANSSLNYASSAASSAASFISPILQQAISRSIRSSTLDTVGKADIDRFYQAKIRPLLDAVDQLRGILNSESITLPTIVVVGDQSSGKSSVLEALSGISLPRGQNITTRCPLVLRLHNLTPDDKSSSVSSTNNNNVIGTQQYQQKLYYQDEKKEDILPPPSLPSLPPSVPSLPSPYAYLTLNPVPNLIKDQKIVSLEDIPARIQSLTNQIAGNNGGISSSPLYLSVYRANSPDLTLVDLPGITRNPIGDQPRDIYSQIKQMIYTYIQPSTSIILNVMPATIDFPTAECVMMSKEVDPSGERTIAVVTKLDLAEKGIRRKLEAASDMLGLKMGVVAVKNRSQEESERGVTWEVSREMEKIFFREHRELGALFNDTSDDLSSVGVVHHQSLLLGTTSLAFLLTTIQEHTIRTTLPSIRTQIRETLAEHRNKLLSFPPSVSTYNECRIRLDHLLSQFLSQLIGIVSGDHSIAKGDTRLHISPRLTEMFTAFKSSLQQTAAHHLSYEYAKVVEEEIKENTGVTLPNFLSHQVFMGLMHREIRKWRDPSIDLVERVRTYLHTTLVILLRQSFAPFPLLINRLTSLIASFMEEKHTLLLSRVDELLAEEGEMYTQNDYYIDTITKVKAQIYEKLYGGSTKEREEREREREKWWKEKREREAKENSPLQSIHSVILPSAVATPVLPIKNPPSAVIAMFSHISSAINPATVSSSSTSSIPSPLPSSLYTFTVNDLTLTIDLISLTLPLSAASTISSSSIISNGTLSSSGLLPSNSTLDMQITCFVYTHLAHKRICDSLPLLMKLHFVRSLHSSTSPSHTALSLRLQREGGEMGEKALMDSMKEEKDQAAKRERLQISVAKLEKALSVLESL